MLIGGPGKVFFAKKKLKIWWHCPIKIFSIEKLVTEPLPTSKICEKTLDRKEYNVTEYVSIIYVLVPCWNICKLNFDFVWGIYLQKLFLTFANYMLNHNWKHSLTKTSCKPFVKQHSPTTICCKPFANYVKLWLRTFAKWILLQTFCQGTFANWNMLQTICQETFAS